MANALSNQGMITLDTAAGGVAGPFQIQLVTLVSGGTAGEAVISGGLVAAGGIVATISGPAVDGAQTTIELDKRVAGVWLDSIPATATVYIYTK